MLKLKDKNKKLVAGLINYKDLCIESVLSTGDKKLSFSLHKEDKFYNLIEEECYIETKTQEYVIKARDVGVDYTRFDCVLNLEELEANIFDRFESVEQTITASLNLAIVGTGWTVNDNTLKKKRTVRCTNKNALEIVQEIKKTYRVDIVFNTLEKQIEIYEHLGEDKGTYFIDSLNLTALQVQSDSYKFATRIIAEGKDGLTFSSINNGKNYVENYQYSNKIKTIYWKDERYTVKESLLEDAKAKLEEISKPFVSYNASILNLAELNPKYKNILDYQLGDTITLISKNNKVKDKQRIVKTVEYPHDHSRDTVELANATLKFEDIQQENQETTSTVNNITVDDGTIDGSTIDGIKVKQIEDFKANVVEVVNLKAINASIDNLHTNKADIQDLHAVTAKIGTLEATKANITQLNATNAEISKLNAIKANITDLNAANGKINVLESKTASIDNLLAGNLTANNFKANSIVAGSAIIAENAIGSSQISSLTANKITTGTIDTSLVTVAGPNGRLKILGNRLQIFDDVNNRLFERIMLGINDKNRACLTLRATDGQTVLLTEEGLTKAGITDGFGKADDNSLSALKLDKNSIVRQVNGATETIAGTRIQVGDRTLDIELSTQKNTITEHGKELSSQKATIQALDNAIKLKVDSQTFTQSTTTINNNINKAKEEAINSANSNTTNSINNIKFGGRNYYLNSSFNKTLDNWSTNDPIIVIKDGYLIMDARNITGPYLDTQQTFNVDSEGTYTMSLDVAEANGTCYMYAIDKTDTDAVQPYTDNCFTLQSKKRNFKVIEGRKGTTRFWSVIRAMKGSYLKCRLAKFEKGNKNSDWTPAPEDVQAYAEEVAKAKSDLAKTEAIANADGKITEEERKRIQQAQENLNTAIARAEKAKQEAIVGARNIQDTRNDNQNPQWYIEHYPKQLINEFKNANVIGISGTTYGILETKVPWGDSSGGFPVQTFRSNNTPTYQRRGLNSTNWSDWEQIEDTQGSQAKANDALSNAKTYVNAEITTVNSHLNKATSEINILKDKIESKVGTADVEKAIQNIKFGGRNLLRNTGLSYDSKFWLFDNGIGRSSNIDSNLAPNNHSIFIDISGVNQDEWRAANPEAVPCIAGEIFSASVLVMIPSNDNRLDDNLNCAALEIQFWDSTGRRLATETTTININTPKDKWYKIICENRVSPPNTVKANARVWVRRNGRFWIGNIKLIKGNKIGDWSPAPEDSDTFVIDNIKTVTDKITTVESNLTQKTNSIEAGVRDLNSTTQSITTNVSNINRDLSNKINSNLDAAKSFATDIAIAKANTAKQEAINTANSNTTNVINNLQIGDRNLAFKTDSESVQVGNNTVNQTQSMYGLNIEELKGKKITISFDWSVDGENISGTFYTQLNNTPWTNFTDTVTVSNSNKKGHITKTINMPNEISATSIMCRKDNFIGTLKIRKLKIVIGNKIGDWSPAPEDLQAYADEVAKAKSELAKQQAIADSDGKITEEERKRIQQAQENLNTAIARADKAKQDAINAASVDATNKTNNALNSAKAYVNAEITTVNNKVHNVESNLNILSDRINTKVSQSDIDKAVTTIRTERIIYARGTGNDYPSNSLVKVNGKIITDGQGRGLRIHALNKITLELIFLQDYDTYGDGNAINNFANKINELNNGDYIIIVTSQDASYPLNPTVKGALEKIGATLFDNKQGTFREAYALIGKSKLGRGNGVEMFIPRTANDKRFAEVSVKVGEGGTFIGVNPNNMGLEATLIKSNISDVSSSVTQLRDSVTTDIRAINSKTQSIETTLGGKASKQEVTEVNNRVATIKANLDSITQRVSSTESKTNSLETNINGKASKQELTVVNNKVTEVTASLNGITQRVGSTESRINALDGKVAGAVTLQQFTEFKQSNDNFKFTVEQRSSVSNILPNSSFHGGDRGWLHVGNEFWSGPYSGYGFKGRITGAIKNRAAYNNPERYLQTHKAYKVKKNTTYTINFHYICEKNVQSMDAFVVLSDTEHGDYAQPICVLTAQGGSQSNAAEEKPFTYKFNTGNHEWVWIRFDHNGMKSGVNWDEFCWIYVSEIGIYEGDVGAVKWTPKGGEVYSANYQMDGLGFKGTFEDGTYASLGKDGLEWFNAGTGHAYHALTYVTSFDIPIGNPGKAYIKLPAEFTKRRNSLKWTVALRGYYYNTTGNFFPFHIHCTGGRDYIENGLVVCEVQGYCKIQNAQNAGDIQFRPLTAMLIAIA